MAIKLTQEWHMYHHHYRGHQGITSLLRRLSIALQETGRRITTIIQDTRESTSLFRPLSIALQETGTRITTIMQDIRESTPLFRRLSIALQGECSLLPHHDHWRKCRYSHLGLAWYQFTDLKIINHNIAFIANRTCNMTVTVFATREYGVTQ